MTPANTQRLPAGTRKQNRRKTLAALAVTACVGMGAAQANAQLSALHANGTSIVNANGTVVPLRGVNLGGLFVMEQWMTPLDSGNTHNDTFNVMQTLVNRFGVATEQSLISTYQNSWIQTGDLDNIKNAGFNVIRVPVWWGQFYSLTDHSPAGWRSDAFTYLDWLVSTAAARGIYVIIDMHGAVGYQSNSDSTGAYNQNQYWGSQDNQGSTQWMWWKIADHYKGNSNIAAFDLLNEPDNPPSQDKAVSVQNDLYTSVRSADSSRMCIMEGTFINWNWSMLPPPSQYGWTNVVYSMHEYAQGTNGQEATDAQVQAGTASQVNDFYAHSGYNVPGYIGEFNDYQYLDAWSNAVNSFNNAGLSWSMWSYKSRTGDSWGYYDPKFTPPIPNIGSDSADTIRSDWQQWTTSNAFSLNGNGINGGGVNTGAGSGSGSGSGGSGSGGGTTGSVDTSAWYNVVNQATGQCLDATGWGTSNGTAVQQYTCGSQQKNQEWQFQSQGNNTYTIVNRFAPSQVIDVSGRGTSDGSLLQTWTYGGGTNQQWKVNASGSGFTIVGVGSGKLIDDPFSTSKLGTQQWIWGADGTAAQVWTLKAQP